MKCITVFVFLGNFEKPIFFSEIKAGRFLYEKATIVADFRLCFF